MNDSSEPMCRYCLAAWGDIGGDACWDHTPRVVAVARQLAAMVYLKEPTDEQIGWFMEDAATVAAVVKDETPVVTDWNPRSLRFRVGTVRFYASDDGLTWKSKP